MNHNEAISEIKRRLSYGCQSSSCRYNTNKGMCHTGPCRCDMEIRNAMPAMLAHIQRLEAVAQAARNASRWMGTCNGGCGEAHRDYQILSDALANLDGGC